MAFFDICFWNSYRNSLKISFCHWFGDHYIFFFKWQEIQPGIPLNMKLKKCFVFTLQISAIFIKLHILSISVRKWRYSSGDCFTKQFRQFFIRIFSVNLLGNSSVIIISNPQKISSATPWEFLSIFFLILSDTPLLPAFTRNLGLFHKKKMFSKSRRSTRLKLIL